MIKATIMKYSVFLFLIFSSASFAQVNHTDSQSNIDNITGNGNLFRSFDQREREVEGYSTIFEHDVPGRIFLKDGKIVDRPEMNYDVLADELLVKDKGAAMAVFRNVVDRFTLIDHSDSLNFVRVQTTSGEKFLQLLVNGDVRLYRVVKKFIKEPEKGPYAGVKTRQLLQNVVYFWQVHQGMPVEIKSKKELVASLNKNLSNNFEPFAKREKISVKDEDDLIRFFRFVNQQQ